MLATPELTTAPRRRSRTALAGAILLAALAAGVAIAVSFRATHRTADHPSGVNARSAAEQHFKAGLELARAGNSGGATNEWSTANALDPGFSAPYFAMATADQAGGRYSAAVKRLEALRLAVPNAEHVTCREADLYFRAARIDSALQIARSAVEREPQCPVAHSALGAALSAHGDYPAAVRELEAAHRLDPEAEGITLNLAQALAKAGRSEEAIRMVGSVLQAGPKHKVQVNMVMGRLQTAYGRDGKPDYPTARVFFERVVKEDPSNVAAVAELGVVLARLKLYRDARVALERASAGGASDAKMVAALAETYSALKDSRAAQIAPQAQALSHLESELDRVRRQRYARTDDADAALRLARLDEQSANVADAVDIVSGVLQKDPNRPEALRLMTDLTRRSRDSRPTAVP